MVGAVREMLGLKADMSISVIQLQSRLVRFDFHAYSAYASFKCGDGSKTFAFKDVAAVEVRTE